MPPRAGAAVTLGGALAGLFAAAVSHRVGVRPVTWLAGGAGLVALAVAVMVQRALAAQGAPGATAPPGDRRRADPRSSRAAALAGRGGGARIGGRDAAGVPAGAAMKRRFTGADLATAISLFYGGTHVVLLALQAALIPRLLTSRRLPITMSIHPAVTGLGTVLLSTTTGFAGVAAVRSADWVLRAATSRTGQELALSALPPVPRARWKVLLRGAGTPLGAALAGGALIALGPLTITGPRVAMVMAGVVMVWLVAVRNAAARFLAALAAPLGMRAVALARREPAHLDLDLLIRMVAATGQADPLVAGAARAALARAGGAADEITPHLAHDEPAVRRALYLLAAARPRPEARGELAAATAIEDDEACLLAAIRALAAHRAGDALVALGRRPPDHPVVTLAPTAPRPSWTATRRGARRRRRPPGRVRRRLGRCAGRTRRWHATDAAVTAALAAGGDRRRHGLTAATAGGPATVAALLGRARRWGPRRGAGDRDARRRRLPATCTPSCLRWRRPACSDRLGPAAYDTPGPLLATPGRGPSTTRSAPPRCAQPGRQARAGWAPPTTELCARLVERERAEVVALDRRRPRPGDAPALHGAEVERALRAALDRLLTAVALASAAAGWSPAPVLAAARRLVTASEPARRRALDVVQELSAVELRTLDAIEAALRPPGPTAPRGHAPLEPWLAGLLDGAHGAREPALAALRACRCFDGLPGRHADDLAARAGRRHLAPGDVLISHGEPGAEMYVVVSGALAVDGDPAPLGPGRVVGELALIDDAPRAATVRAAAATEVLVIERATFERALTRWPEVGLALCRDLATMAAGGR
ncbi:MAG: cyclic nucleotide-binding domain-containing protein [Kofleriaceae bacterium]